MRAHCSSRWWIVSVLSVLVSPSVGAGEIENGDVNGDGRRDISDAVYLLDHLFLGGPPPVEGDCPESLDCRPPERVDVLENGDVNGSESLDIADAVSLLSWLFRAGPEPVALCSCGAPACEDDTCPRGATCVPLPASLGLDFICTTDLGTCEEVEDLYLSLVDAAGESCDPDVGCHIVFGHCGVGLGGCYYAVPRTLEQAHLDALSERFVDLGGLESCPRGVCRCTRPPEGTVCDVGGCRFDE